MNSVQCTHIIALGRDLERFVDYKLSTKTFNKSDTNIISCLILFKEMSCSSESRNSSACSNKRNMSHEDQNISEYKKGDIIAFFRPDKKITHYGIYYGNEIIIHVSGESKSNSEVKLEKLMDVKHGDKSWVANDDEKWGNPANPSVIVQRAFQNEGPFQYNLIVNNCEHFATFCRYGEPHSKQTEILEKILPVKKFCQFKKKAMEKMQSSNKKAAAYEKKELSTFVTNQNEENFKYQAPYPDIDFSENEEDIETVYVATVNKIVSYLTND
ncbi:hypothetical protein Btru_063315 [Bulinus truncatus]|nr:hypothetical protein Btru_063315 [Bulinus truncatus]